MNQTVQVQKFLLCLSHIDDAYLNLHTRTSVASSPHREAHNHDHVDDDDGRGQQLLAKIVAMVVLFCASVTCGSVPFLLNRSFKWTENNQSARSAVVVRCLLYLGGGVLLCTTFLHLLPEVRETVTELQECGIIPQLPFALAELLMCSGFFFMYFIEELIHAYTHRHKWLSEVSGGAGAAFERRHSMRERYLVKANGRPQRPPRASEKSTMESVECTTSSNAQQVQYTAAQPQTGHHTTHGGDHEKYTQDPPQLYSSQAEQLDLPHHCHHHTDQHLAHHQHHHHHYQHFNDSAHRHLHVSTGTDAEPENTIASSLSGLPIVLALSLHELFEGMTIGLENSATSVWFMFGAVSAHKLVLAFCVGVEMCVTHTRLPLAVFYVITFGIVSPIGIAIGILVSHGGATALASLASALLQGMACGTLLYVVFFEIISKNRAGLRAYLALIAGFAIMFALQWFGGSGEHGHSHGGCGSKDDQPSQHDHSGQHDVHADQWHIPMETAVTDFERQLQILRAASHELMEHAKKN